MGGMRLLHARWLIVNESEREATKKDIAGLQDARVRLTVDGCISLLWPQDDWTGTVKEIRQVAGQTRLLIQFDKPTPAGRQTEEVPEHEVERV
jgi:hypothetical protein